MIARPIRPNLKLLVLIQTGLTLTMALGGALLGSLYLGASMGVGAGLMLANLLLVAWIWQRSFDKKSIAWTSMIIVIKYAVLLASIFVLVQADWFNPLGAGLGVASMALTALIFAFFYYKKEKIYLG